MADAATISANIAKLESALAKGVLSGKDGDSSFTFRSVTELKDAIAYWRAKQSELDATGIIGTSVVYFERS